MRRTLFVFGSNVNRDRPAEVVRGAVELAGHDRLAPVPDRAVHHRQARDGIERLQLAPLPRCRVQACGRGSGRHIPAVSAEHEQLLARPHRCILFTNAQRAGRQPLPGVGAGVICRGGRGTIRRVAHVDDHPAARPHRRGTSAAEHARRRIGDPPPSPGPRVVGRAVRPRGGLPARRPRDATPDDHLPARPHHAGVDAPGHGRRWQGAPRRYPGFTARRDHARHYRDRECRRDAGRQSEQSGSHDQPPTTRGIRPQLRLSMDDRR